MTIYRYKPKLALLASCFLIVSCGTGQTSNEDPVLLQEEYSRALPVLESDGDRPLRQNSSDQTSNYSASDVVRPEPSPNTSSADAEYYKSVERDLKNQEIDRRLRQLEQDAQLREAEEAARRANEKYNSTWNNVPEVEIEPYRTK